MTIVVPVETAEDVRDVICCALSYNSAHRAEVFGDDPRVTFTQETLANYAEFDNFALIFDGVTNRWYVGLGCCGPLAVFTAVFPTALDFVTGDVTPTEICGPHPQLFEDDPATGKLRWSERAIAEQYVISAEKSGRSIEHTTHAVHSFNKFRPRQSPGS